MMEDFIMDYAVVAINSVLRNHRLESTMRQKIINELKDEMQFLIHTKSSNEIESMANNIENDFL